MQVLDPNTKTSTLQSPSKGCKRISQILVPIPNYLTASTEPKASNTQTFLCSTCPKPLLLCFKRLESTPLSTQELLYETGPFAQKLKHILITALKKKIKSRKQQLKVVLLLFPRKPSARGEARWNRLTMQPRIYFLAVVINGHLKKERMSKGHHRMAVYSLAAFALPVCCIHNLLQNSGQFELTNLKVWDQILFPQWFYIRYTSDLTAQAAQVISVPAEEVYASEEKQLLSTCLSLATGYV